MKKVTLCLVGHGMDTTVEIRAFGPEDEEIWGDKLGRYSDATDALEAMRKRGWRLFNICHGLAFFEEVVNAIDTKAQVEPYIWSRRTV